MTGPDQPDRYLMPAAPDLPHPLGRHVNHDPRSRAFAFTAPADVQLQAVRWQRRVPIFDQGNTSSCTGNAAAGWLATANALRPGLTRVVTPSEGDIGAIDEAMAREIYSDATQIDPFDGTYPPTDTGSDGLSVTKVLQQLGAVDSYQHAFDVAAVLQALQAGPVLIGTAWHQDMFRPGPAGLVAPSGAVVGGHEYLAVGYEPVMPHTAATPGVVFANSWGPGWGDAGHFRMTVTDLQLLLGDDGDATIPHALVTAPTPEPVSPPGFPVDLDPDVAAHVARAAARRRIEPSQWVNNRLRHYFD